MAYPRVLTTIIGSLVLLMAGTAGGGARAQGQQPAPGPLHQLFVTSDNCVACHNGLITPKGEDVSIGDDWSASMMANSARDPYWQAAVRRETLDHPESSAAIQNECSACHMPMARYTANVAGENGKVFAHLPLPGPGAAAAQAPLRTLLAEDGVSCAMCHQITAEGLGTEESFVAGFHVDTQTPLGQRQIFGPFQTDQGRKTLMSSATGFTPQQGTHMQSSELCATCHTLYTEALGEGGKHMGELPEQMPYLEWQHSSYPGEQSCQNCHMPVVEGEMPLTAVLGQPRQGFNRHVFRGGNFFMMRMLNRYRQELAVKAPSQALEAAARNTVDHLQSGAAARIGFDDVTIENGVLTADLTVENPTGHKLPTAYPSRRVWLHVRVRDRNGEVVFESGAFRESGAIVGNDNDTDKTRYEPHYDVIDSPEKVQVYEGILAGPDGNVTTGLLTATDYAKDNRLLPRGFDKTTADADIDVHGGARQDDDFTDMRDSIRYRVDVGNAQGPFSVEAEVWYQPIAYRWAENLAAYDSFETNRFVRYYRSMSDVSAIVLTRASATVSAP